MYAVERLTVENATKRIVFIIKKIINKIRLIMHSAEPSENASL